MPWNFPSGSATGAPVPSTRGPRRPAADLAIVRVERLYPFPTEELGRVLERYPKIEKLAWVQEEPRNMGARKFVLPKIRHLVPYKIPLGDISRPERSRPAEGYPTAHHAEQARIVRVALDLEDDRLEPDSSSQRPVM